MGTTLIVAILGVLIGGAGFLPHGIALFMAWLLGIMVFLAVLTAGGRINFNITSFTVATVISAIFWFVTERVVEWVFTVVSHDITNPWLLAVVGGLLSDIVLGIIAAGVILVAMGMGLLGGSVTTRRWY